MIFRQYLQDVENAAKGFLALGLEPHHGVGIMSPNVPEWFISSNASIFAGGLVCGIYTTTSPENVTYISNHVPLNILIMEDKQMLKKTLNGRTVKEAFPTVKKIRKYSSITSEF